MSDPCVSAEDRTEYERQKVAAPLVVAEVERWKAVAKYHRERADKIFDQAFINGHPVRELLEEAEAALIEERGRL
jgi:hypothetical protein